MREYGEDRSPGNPAGVQRHTSKGAAIGNAAIRRVWEERAQALVCHEQLLGSPHVRGGGNTIGSRQLLHAGRGEDMQVGRAEISPRRSAYLRAIYAIDENALVGRIAYGKRKAQGWESQR